MSIDGSRIKLLVLDVDGTMTDGGMYILESGDQFKRFDSKDGLGISQAINRGLVVGIISHSKSAGAIRKRVEMLGIQRCYVGQAPKLGVLDEWCRELGIGYEAVAFIGDDLNDLDIIEIAGVSACPANAIEAVKDACDVVLKKAGGYGAVREFIDRFCAADIRS